MPDNADLIRLLREIDGQLGLAVHRGEGSRIEWKFESAELINRIRATIADLSRQAVTVYCNQCGKSITMTEPDLSENGRLCGACAVRISLGDKP